MGRTVRNRTPIRPKPVEKIELSAKHIGLRAAAAVIFLVMGASALAYTFVNFLNGDKGWRRIEVSAGAITCADDFVFLYDVGSGGSVHTENRALMLLYSELTKEAYELFNAEVEVENVKNLWYLNHHPNEETAVEPALYSAFEKIENSGSRHIYLGPAYEIYDSLFYLSSPEYADYYDPALSPELRELYQKISDFARSEEDVKLVLLGDNRVRLDVSDGYQRFAEENGIERYIDLYWLKNAFITDFLAEKISGSGYTHGVISSFDGFERCLSKTDESFDFSINAAHNGIIYPAAVMEYSGRRSIVNLRAYPINSRDGIRYAEIEGEMRSQYLSLESGMNQTAADEITAYSKEFGCADIALALADIYTADSLDESAVRALSEVGIDTVYCVGTVLKCSDPSIRLKDVFSAEDISFSVENIG